MYVQRVLFCHSVKRRALGTSNIVEIRSVILDFYCQMNVMRKQGLTSNCEILLLLLDDNFLPYFMEWTSHDNLSDLILFLLECDIFRFKSDPSTIILNFERLVSTYLRSNSNLIRILPQQVSSLILDSLKIGIPIPSILAVACEIVWEELFTRILHDNISSSMSWNALRRSIVGDFKVELLTILMEDSFRIFLEEFSLDRPSDLAALYIWKETRSILDALEHYKIGCEDNQKSSTTSTTTNNNNNNNHKSIINKTGNNTSSNSTSSVVKRKSFASRIFQSSAGKSTTTTTSHSMNMNTNTSTNNSELGGNITVRNRRPSAAGSASSSNTVSSDVTATLVQSTAPSVAAAGVDVELGSDFSDPYEALKVRTYLSIHESKYINIKIYK